MRGPHDSTGDEASLILTSPPSPLSLDLHPGFTHFYLFAHSHYIHSFSGLIAAHPQGTLNCEACHPPPSHPSGPHVERPISKTRRYTNVVCCPDMLNATVSPRTRGPWHGAHCVRSIYSSSGAASLATLAVPHSAMSVREAWNRVTTSVWWSCGNSGVELWYKM